MSVGDSLATKVVFVRKSGRKYRLLFLQRWSISLIYYKKFFAKLNRN
jgi:hypothetical protein